MRLVTKTTRILPTRNGNGAREARATWAARTRILPTRNGNQEAASSGAQLINNTDPTYKEWKPHWASVTTYRCWTRILPTRNGNSSDLLISMTCSDYTDPTYKEWKPANPSDVHPAILITRILPTRNGNTYPNKAAFTGKLTRILPTRNGNKCWLHTHWVITLNTDPTYKEWKLQVGKSGFIALLGNTDPTYKEWKHRVYALDGGVERGDTDPTYKEWKRSWF